MSELNVQKYLRSGKTLVNLGAELYVYAKEHPTLPLVILDYDMLESPKTHPIVQECRGLILQKGSWDVVCKPFSRFFNLGENPTNDANFVWKGSSALDKEDGSLVNLWKYNNVLYCSTRFSFCDSPINTGLKTWGEYIFQCFDLYAAHEILDDYSSLGITFVCEFCSPYNKVVRAYEKPRLFLLTCFDNLYNRELEPKEVYKIAYRLKIECPTRYTFSGPNEVVSHLEKMSNNDATYEGVVLRDKNGLRLKVKTPKYLALHRLRGENPFHPKHLIPFVIGQDESDELLTYYPELKGNFNKLKDIYDKVVCKMNNYWFCFHGEKNQKKFALAIKECPLSGILFAARQSGQPLESELKTLKGRKYLETYLLAEFNRK